MKELELPNIKKEEFGFEGEIQLEVWSKFGSSQDDAISELERKSYLIDIGGDMVEDNPSIKLEHVNAYNYLIENQEKIKANILTAIIDEYPKLIKQKGNLVSESPKFLTFTGLQGLIRLSTIHILNVEKNDFAYVGYEFDTPLDKEHGLGIMTHQDRIVEIGDADTSFLSWIARKDKEA